MKNVNYHGSTQEKNKERIKIRVKNIKKFGLFIKYICFRKIIDK